MRITDFPLQMDVKEEYLDLRKAGRSREDAKQEMLSRYSDEITTGAEDDGLLFWVGLADAQYANRELTSDVSQQAVAALNVLEHTDWNITSGDIRRRRENYARAPMPEKRIGKPRPKFRCSWTIGDTFAYRLTGTYAEESGTEGAYILLRKVSDAEWGDGSLYPVLYLSLWNKETLPCTAEEYQSAPLLKVNRERFGLPRTCHEYRTALLVKNKKQLDSLPLVYLGNFPSSYSPEDEVVIEGAAMMTLTSIEYIDQDLCVYILRTRRYE